MDCTLSEFSSTLRKARGPHLHKVRNSYGVYDYYKFYRKNKPKDKKYVLSESQYFAIIRRINEALAELFIHGKEIKFPARMGTLELRKTLKTPKLTAEGKVVFHTVIDWDKTIKLWYEDPESLQKKTLVRQESKEIYKSFYNKTNANYKNKSYFIFKVGKEVRRALSKNIKKGIIDAFLVY